MTRGDGNIIRRTNYLPEKKILPQGLLVENMCEIVFFILLSIVTIMIMIMIISSGSSCIIIFLIIFISFKN